MKRSGHSRLVNSRPLKKSKLRQVYDDLKRAFSHQKWWPGDSAFEIMVGAILTQNTAWRNVELAIENLKRARCLTPEAIRRLSAARLRRLIRPAGFYNVKVRRLKAFVEFIFREYEGDVGLMRREDGMKLREKLLAVHGVGEETADSILLYALDKPFFVIDAYTKRIFSRHGLHEQKADYSEWQQVFMRNLPKGRGIFKDYHAQIVQLGKQYCRTRPHCKGCPLEKYLN